MTKKSYEDAPVTYFLYPSLFFLLLGMLTGLFLSLNAFVFPNYFSGEYIQFGRIRPVHVSMVTLLWLLSADVALLYFIIPRLCGRSLWSPFLAKVHACLWWSSLIIGTFAFPFGNNFGWEYAELPKWVSFVPCKFLFTLSWLLFSINLMMTISKRRHERMYVSLWYAMGCLLWTSVVYTMGNFIIEWIPAGASRINLSFFYVHNLVGLVFTPAGIAIAYYMIPKITKLPIYSHRLSMIGFWTIAFFYAWVGTHHIIHGPFSQWLQTTSIVFSIWLIIPVSTVVWNFIASLKPHWEDLYPQNAAVRFLMMGTLFYMLVCLQGPIQALRHVNEITSKTDWIIGHSHMALYGAFSFFAFAGIYHVVPIITKKPLYSKNLSDWHFALNLWGSLLFFFVLWTGGFLQGLSWTAWSEGSTYAQFHKNLSEYSFLQSIAHMRIWWILRAFAGGMLVIANSLFVYNISQTVWQSDERESS